jgi:hypothetical protein
VPIPYERPDHVLAAVRRYDKQMEAELDAFIESKLVGQRPRRKDKPCGKTLTGAIECQLHLDLNLWHYRLCGNADPILVYQPLAHVIQLVGVTFHEEMFHGNGLRWCYDWQDWICWDGHEIKRDVLNDTFG